MSHILIADDDKNMRVMLSKILEEEGHEVFGVQDGSEAVDILKKEKGFQLVITDLKMPRLDGVGLLSHIKENFSEVLVVIITAHGTIESAVQAMKLGAYDYITKPFNIDEIKIIVDKALCTQRGRVKEGFFKEIIGQSQKMQDIYKIIDKVANTDSTVFIQGESGTGKELVAKAIHNNSNRKDKPFIAVNCAALSENLLESELFGHEKGAFTGAISRHPGRFELADKGTLFLDEISELPLFLQSKLLRVLQEKEFERVGGTESIKVDVRIISATSMDIRLALKEGGFREDLYYRLNVVPILIPPLRERKEDIPQLIEYFLKGVKKITGPARDILISYNWPGNIRELENTIERMVVLSQDEVLDIVDIPPEIRGERSESPSSLKEVVQATSEVVEKQHILDVLKETGGNITKAARIMKISRVTLQNKLKYYNINTSR